MNGCGSRSGAANQLGTHERSASERARLSVTTRLIRRHCQRPCHAVDTPVLLGLPKLSNQVGEARVRTSLQLRTLRARARVGTTYSQFFYHRAQSRRVEGGRKRRETRSEYKTRFSRTFRVKSVVCLRFLSSTSPSTPVRSTLVASRAAPKNFRGLPRDLTISCETLRSYLVSCTIAAPTARLFLSRDKFCKNDNRTLVE